MRRIVPLAVALLAVHLCAGRVSAQAHFNGLGMAYPTCGYTAPPRAPDFCNTRPFYYTTAFGMTYGPNYHVYPGFAPYQGMLPPPREWSCGPSGGQALAGTAAFPSHLYARGPRDFYMVETDPRSSPYTYGLTNFSTVPQAALGLPAPLGGAGSGAGMQSP